MSKYDEIKSPNELVREVAMHGLSTLQEDICRAQDIFGRAPIEELIQLANNDGRRDDEGNPKLGGKWSSGKDGTQKTFYQILFSIWHWEDATRFYNEHTNVQMKTLQERSNKLTELEKAYGELQEDNQEISSELDKVRTELRKSETMRSSQDVLILKLKARLYDVFCEEEIEYA